MKGRYIILAIIIIYLAIVLVAAIFVIKEEPEAENTPTPTPTSTVPKPQCESDRDTIQTALDAYHEANDDWPTADGQPGDIVWDKLIPEYMSAMPSIDSSCDWQVSGNPEGSVCVSHTC